MKIALLAAALSLAAAPALAQPAGSEQHQGMAHGKSHHDQMAMKDYKAGMQEMHQSMMKTHDADADRSFALMMIEHHRGALAMTDALGQHGDDVELKAMAAKSKAMQQKEIGELQAWLDRHGGRTPKK
ncbi:MAG: DUF305 domain-containing protein [Phenylobacterium sp.]|nr:DUF305 domain-containing protein [Phenylobacterium sp.]